jgi:hypothetical protein
MDGPSLRQIGFESGIFLQGKLTLQINRCFPLVFPICTNSLQRLFLLDSIRGHRKYAHENSILRKKVEEFSGFKVLSETKRYSTSNPKRPKKGTN